MKVLSGVLMSCHLASAAIHVAPRGQDTAPGDADRPVATLARAVELSRGLPAGAEKQILVHGGRYFDTRVELSPADSGLTIEAAAGKTPVLYGGLELGGWQTEGETVWAPVPAGVEIRALEVDGALAPRARYPAEGTLTHTSEFKVRWMSTTGGGWERKPTPEELTTLVYSPGDLPADLDLANAEVTVYHMWDESCVGLASHDPATRTLRFSSPCGHPPGAFGVKKYVVWNTREGLTAPGQWYHDRTRQRLVYRPRPGQRMEQVLAVAGTRETILALRGSQAEPVRNVTLRGLTLAATTVPLRAAGFAANAYDGAVSLQDTADCRLEKLTIGRVGGHAVNTRRGATGTYVGRCRIGPCGAGGLYIGGSGAIVEDNLVHDVGLAYPSAIGIYRGGQRNIVRHNEVHGCSYSAINYGGTENLIEGNLIYDCMKVLHDGAAVYVFAGQRTIIRGNFARDIIDTGGYGASAWYLDERSEGCLVEGNLSLRVNWPFHNHMAKGNTIRHNVALVEGDARITFPKSSDYVFEGNIIVARGKIRFETANAVTHWARNLLHPGNGTIERVLREDYKVLATELGPPGDTVVGDPLFRDPAAGDFGFRPGSPALALGLPTLDVRTAGIRPE